MAPLGFNRRFKKFFHVDRVQALDHFQKFYWWRRTHRWWWKNYVIDDHIRFIVEVTPNPLYFGRSLFRSYQAFADPEEIEDIIWVKYYVAERNKKTGTFNILLESPPDKYEDVRQLYREHKGVGNWCK